ncbi:MAG: ABC transporter permease [Lactobacillales bacterium]|jgi:microcin C transport system permease protein|nr:ABC transporter permease [Lactobacillales bacterium]
MHPLTKKRFKIFKSNKRAFWSAWILGFVLLFSLCAPFLANDRPLFVLYKNTVYFPVFEQVLDSDLGGDLPTEADYADPFTQKQILKYGMVIPAPVPYRYDTIDYFSLNPFPEAPSQRHWLGTDDQGRDLIARLIYGIRLNLSFGIVLTVLSALIGICVGAVQGYFGGKIDLLIGRFLEIWGSLPQLFILIIISSLIEPSFWSLLVILLLFSWTSLTSVVRAEFLKVRAQDYVKSARALGVGDFSIMVRHILPNALVATITYIPFILSGAIISLSALDFLGLGLPPGTPSLGEMVHQGKENLQAPWIGFTAFSVLTVLLSLLIFVGEGIRDAFDPHKQEGA